MVQHFDSITTAPELAAFLDINEKTLRHWLREEFPDDRPGKGKRWEITMVMRRQMRARALRLGR